MLPDLLEQLEEKLHPVLDARVAGNVYKSKYFSLYGGEISETDEAVVTGVLQ